MSKYNDLMRLAKRIEEAKKELHFAARDASSIASEAAPYLTTAAREANRGLEALDRAIGTEARSNAT